MRDPWAAAEVAPYIGFLSQVGGFFWISTAAMCVLSSHLISLSGKRDPRGSFLKWTGLFSLLLAIDETFSIHDYLFPFVLRISDHILLGGYGAFLLLLIAKNLEIIRNTSWKIFLLAILAFSGSLIIDTIHIESEARIFAEDGLKFLGITCWMTYFGDASASALSKAFVPNRD